jgi:prepilin-type N-terminal cleavage/methylation domain-containing protein
LFALRACRPYVFNEFMIKTRNRGFTLVELLVVIAIIAVLASTTAVMAPKMRKKGLQTKEITNMRQIMAMMNTYSIDNSNRFPPAATKGVDNDTGKDIYWFTQLQQAVNNDDLAKLAKNDWWKSNPSIFLNPLMPKNKISASTVGYAMNAALAVNIAKSRGDSLENDLSVYTPINIIGVREPERTPIVMPHWSYAYICNPKEAADKRFNDFLVNDRLPVLYMDGHVDSMTTKEYAKKELYLLPKEN